MTAAERRENLERLAERLASSHQAEDAMRDLLESLARIAANDPGPAGHIAEAALKDAWDRL